MAKVNKNELTKEQIEKAMRCKTADELMNAAKAEGFDITKEEAEAFLAEFGGMELDEETMKKVAGGGYIRQCNGYTPCRMHDRCRTKNSSHLYPHPQP